MYWQRSEDNCPFFLRWNNNGNEGLNYAAQIPCQVVRDLSDCIEIHLNDFNTAIDSVYHQEDLLTVQSFGRVHDNPFLNFILNAAWTPLLRFHTSYNKSYKSGTSSFPISNDISYLGRGRRGTAKDKDQGWEQRK